MSERTMTTRKTILTERTIMTLAVIERVVFFFWGLYQDNHMALRYTDIDYFVFTDAARFVFLGESPYERETYRYTPLLAWMLTPTVYFFSFGKILFALGDLIAGYLILLQLRKRNVPENKAIIYSSVWLLNPMVCTISTRGSSEALLAAMVMAMIWAVETKRLIVAGLITGLAVHFKIYPIIYVPTILWSLSSTETSGQSACSGGRKLIKQLIAFFNKDRLIFGISSVVSFTLLTGAMYIVYGDPFLQHAYLHHLSRVDHRHNFSPYSTVLYMGYSPAVDSSNNHLASLAFIPQLLLSGIVLPLAFAKKDIVKTMFIQTFTFVTFNKVCTSQYFMWYMVLVPFYLSSIRSKTKPIIALVQWIIGQVVWIRQGYLLEFLGEPKFYDLFMATIYFFFVNVWSMGIFLDSFETEQDVAEKKAKDASTKK